MKKLMTAAALLTTLTAAAQWHPAGDRIKTSWGEGLDPANVLAEYPRPQMVRGEWQNLNGLWNYAIRPAGEVPVAWDGEILVPFAAESSLSGVGRRVGAEQELWYERSFTIPAKWSGRRVLLHFGAVDWRADVWVNGVSPWAATRAVIRRSTSMSLRRCKKASTRSACGSGTPRTPAANRAASR